MAPRLNTFIYFNGVGYGPDSELPDELVAKLEKDGTPGIWADEADDSAISQEGGDQGNADVVRLQGQVTDLQEDVLRLAGLQSDIARLADFLEVEPSEAIDAAISVLSAPKHEPLKDVELEALKFDQLKALAAERGVDVEGKTSKAQIIEALKAAQPVTPGQ